MMWLALFFLLFPFQAMIYCYFSFFSFAVFFLLLPLQDSEAERSVVYVCKLLQKINSEEDACRLKKKLKKREKREAQYGNLGAVW